MPDPGGRAARRRILGSATGVPATREGDGEPRGLTPGHDGVVTTEDASDEPVLEFIPALTAILLAAERSAGRRLTESEVLEIRDRSTCIRMPRSAAEAIARERGYDDLGPEYCWEQWQDARTRWEIG